MMQAKRAITPIIAVVMMLLMTVAAAGAVFTWYQQFQQQQLQQVSKRAAALAQNIQFSITDVRWLYPYKKTVKVATDGTNHVNVTFVAFYTVIQNSGDDIDLNSKNPLAYLEITKLASGESVALSSPGKLVVGTTNQLTAFPLSQYIGGSPESISSTTTIDNTLKIEVSGSSISKVTVLSPITCYRLSLEENLGHPENIIASGETARLQCVIILNVTPSSNTITVVDASGNNYNGISNYDPADTYQEVIAYGSVTQTAQILK